MVESGKSNKNRLRVRRLVDVPLREVSGICSRRGRNCRMFLIAVGDRVAKPAAFIEFGPPHSRSRGLVRGGALADGERWPIKKGHHRFVALAIWLPDKRPGPKPELIPQSRLLAPGSLIPL